MPQYYSPEGNLEVWDTPPEGYLSEEEWIIAQGPPSGTAPTYFRTTQFSNSLYARLHTFLSERNWDDMATVLSQTGVFANDAAVAQREYDKIWTAAIDLSPLLADMDIPIDDVISQLPILSWE